MSETRLIVPFYEREAHDREKQRKHYWKNHQIDPAWEKKQAEVYDSTDARGMVIKEKID